MKKLRWFLSAAVLMLVLLAFPALRQGEQILGKDIANISVLQQYGVNYVLKIERTGEFSTVYRNLRKDTLGQHRGEFDEGALAQIEAALAQWDGQQQTTPMETEAPRQSGTGTLPVFVATDAALAGSKAESLPPDAEAPGGEICAGTGPIPFLSGSQITAFGAGNSTSPLSMAHSGGRNAGFTLILEETQDVAAIETAEPAGHPAIRSPKRPIAVLLPVLRPASVRPDRQISPVTVRALAEGYRDCGLLLFFQSVPAPLLRTEGCRFLRKIRFRPLRVYSPGISEKNQRASQVLVRWFFCVKIVFKSFFYNTISDS